jgi:hypothetical protein
VVRSLLGFRAEGFNVNIKTIWIGVCLLAVAGIPFSRLKAQTTANIEGTVTNVSGAPTPNVKVQLNNEATNQTTTAMTDSNGHYRFSGVPVGRYRVQTEGAQPVEWDVQTGGSNIVNLTLTNSQPAIATDTVTSTAIPLQLKNAQIEHSWNGWMVKQIPEANLLTKDGQGFGGYNLGITSEAVATVMSVARGLAAGGQGPLSNNFSFDGTDNNNKAQPGPLVYIPNTATLETSLFENQATPVFGHTMGGKFNTNSRSGTNELHGEFYDYLENTHLNAIDQSWARMGLMNRPRFDQNRLGAAIGFPILQSKIFFFGNFEYIPTGFTAPFSGPMYAPTAAGFQELENTPGVSATNLGILQAAIPNVGPATQTISVGGQAIPVGLMESAQSGFQNQYIGSGGFDYMARSSDTLHLRYVHNKTDANFSGPSLSYFNTPSTTMALLGTFAEEHVFSPTAMNEFRAGYNRFDQGLGQFPGSFAGLSSMPDIQIGGLSNLTLGPAGFADSSVYNTYQGSDTFTLNRGAHDFKFGADVMWLVDSRNGLAAFRGNYMYSSLERYLMDLPPDVLAQQGFGSSYMSDNRQLVSAFAQDNWQVRPGLTVNLGVRYSFTTLPKALRQAGLDSVANGGGVFFKEPSLQTTNFAPNVGIAYSPGSSRDTVFRAGFGMMYDALYNPYLLYGGPFLPQTGGALVTGTMLGNTPGFLAGGGLASPVTQPIPFGSLTGPQAAALTSTFVPPNQKLPYSIQWNAAVQHTLGHGAAVELKYLGSKDVHLPLMSFLNQVSPVSAQQNLPLFLQAPSQAQLDALPTTLAELQGMPTNPLAQFGFTNPITQFQNVGNSWYHAATVDFTQRMRSFSFNGSYTWSHLISEGTGTPLDLLFGRSRQDSLFDRRDRVALTGVYDFSSFKSGIPLLHYFTNGLSVSATYLYQTAARVPALSNVDTGLLGYGLASPAIFVPAGNRGMSSGVTPLMNSAGEIVAYMADNPGARFIQGAPGMLGNPLRDALSLNPVNNLDLAIAKRFSYRERFGFEIRAEAYNISNHPQYTGVAVNNLAASDLNLFSNLMVPGSAGFADPSMYFSSNPRTLQFALRATF